MTLILGSEDSCLVQLQPKFAMIEHSAKILYLNLSIRGYPKGVRVAVDPRNPIIAIDEHFEKLDVYSISNSLIAIEVRIAINFLMIKQLNFYCITGVGMWRQTVQRYST